jgi:hypothetical protein
MIYIPKKTIHECIAESKTNLVDPYQCHFPPFFSGQSKILIGWCKIVINSWEHVSGYLAVLIKDIWTHLMFILLHLNFQNNIIIEKMESIPTRVLSLSKSHHYWLFYILFKLFFCVFISPNAGNGGVRLHSIWQWLHLPSSFLRYMTCGTLYFQWFRSKGLKSVIFNEKKKKQFQCHLKPKPPHNFPSLSPPHTVAFAVVGSCISLTFCVVVTTIRTTNTTNLFQLSFCVFSFLKFIFSS